MHAAIKFHFRPLIHLYRTESALSGEQCNPQHTKIRLLDREYDLDLFRNFIGSFLSHRAVNSEHVYHATCTFYRASAYTACRARYCFTSSVRLSVRPMPTVSKWTDISSHCFDGLVGSSSSLLSPTTVTNLQSEPLGGGVKCTGVGKFSKYCHLSQKRYKRDPLLLWNTNRKS